MQDHELETIRGTGCLQGQRLDISPAKTTTHLTSPLHLLRLMVVDRVVQSLINCVFSIWLVNTLSLHVFFLVVHSLLLLIIMNKVTGSIHGTHKTSTHLRYQQLLHNLSLKLLSDKAYSLGCVIQIYYHSLYIVKITWK